MPVYRVTVFFGQSNMGWSESYYYNASNLSGFSGTLTELLNKRAALLTDIHEIDGVRISIEGDNRRSKLMTAGPNQVLPGVIVTVPPKGTFPTGSQGIKYDQVRVCLQVVLASQGVNLALRYFDGIPDETTATENGTVNYGNPPAWWSRWKIFEENWRMRGWQIKMLDKTLANPERPIIKWILRNAEPNVLGLVVSNVSPLAVAVGDKVNIRGVRNKYTGIRTPNGVWVVDEVEEVPAQLQQIVYLRGATAFDPAMIKTLGFARKQVFIYQAPDIIEIVRAGIHKRGKRFGTPRGRARVIRYAN